MEVKIRFTDQSFGFHPEKNNIYRILSKQYRVQLSEEPDFVFYGPFGTEYLRYGGAVRVFMMTEPVYPNFNDCDYAIGTLNMQLPGRYFRMPPHTDYGEDELWQALLHVRKSPSHCFERKFCNFVYSNAVNGEGAQTRIRFCQKLAEYRAVDCPGKVLNNMPGQPPGRNVRMRRDNEKDFNDSWVWPKLELLKNYKFSIAFENVRLPGWTTEKLIHPFMAGSIPIYWGDPEVGCFFNEKAFINANDYDRNFDMVIRRVKELDQNRDAYLEMLDQPVLSDGYPIGWKDDLGKFLHMIIERGSPGFEKNPMGFPAMSALDYAGQCRAGKIGMKKILRDTAASLKGWAGCKMDQHTKETRA